MIGGLIGPGRSPYEATLYATINLMPDLYA